MPNSTHVPFSSFLPTSTVYAVLYLAGLLRPATSHGVRWVSDFLRGGSHPHQRRPYEAFPFLVAVTCPISEDARPARSLTPLPNTVESVCVAAYSIERGVQRDLRALLHQKVRCESHVLPHEAARCSLGLVFDNAFRCTLATSPRRSDGRPWTQGPGTRTARRPPEGSRQSRQVAVLSAEAPRQAVSDNDSEESLSSTWLRTPEGARHQLNRVRRRPSQLLRRDAAPRSLPTEVVRF